MRARDLAYRTAYSAMRVWWRAAAPLSVGVQGIFLHGDRIVLVRHPYGHPGWSLPGGGVGRREAPEAAVVRELREETGCSGVVDGLVGAYFSTREGKSNHVLVYVGRLVAEPRPRPPPSGEVVAAGIFDLADLPEPLSPGTARRLSEWRGQEGLVPLREW